MNVGSLVTLKNSVSECSLHTQTTVMSICFGNLHHVICFASHQFSFQHDTGYDATSDVTNIHDQSLWWAKRPQSNHAHSCKSILFYNHYS